MKIKEEVNVLIGGIKQYLKIEGEDETNPILLTIHGGPATPFSPITDFLPKTYQKEFMLVTWDQRGAGKSYHDNIPEASMTIEQIINDGIEVVDYLLKKFNQKKLFLLGFSWGSVIGCQMAQRIPEKLHAYITFGQVVDTDTSEKISYDYLLKEVKRIQHEEALKDLERIGRPPYKSMEDLFTQRKWFVSLGYSERFANSNQLYQEYCTEDDLMGIMKGLQFTEPFFQTDEIIEYEAQNVPNYEIPVYFFVGKYDYQTAWELQEKYYQMITAPKKDLIWFERSSHAVILEEPEKFVDELVKIKQELINE